MAGRRPLLTRCARPAPPTPPTHSPWRIDAPPDSERLAPAAALTLHRTPNGATGSRSSSPWVQKAYLAAPCRCPPLPVCQLARDASARRRRPPLVSAVSLRDPATPAAALPQHLQHPWQREPPSNFDLSGCVGPERANCPRTPYNPTCTFEDTVKIPFFKNISQTNRLIERFCT